MVSICANNFIYHVQHGDVIRAYSITNLGNDDQILRQYAIIFDVLSYSVFLQDLVAIQSILWGPAYMAYVRFLSAKNIITLLKYSSIELSIRKKL